MRTFGKWLGRVLLALLMLGTTAAMFGPYEPAEVDVMFDSAKLDGGIDAYLAAREARFDDLTESVEKRVIWAGAPEHQTDIAVLYVHGFSATSEELRPVPDLVADALGANLVFTRLAGHGRPGAALGEVTIADWMEDVAEALAVARKAGREVIVIATSTGATLISEALLQPELAEAVRAVVFVSPNFGINDPKAWLLTLPGARWFIPLLVGRERSWEPQSDLVAKYWTTRYPMRAVLTLARLVKHAREQDYSRVEIPALFYFSDGDAVVRADESRKVAARWGQVHGGRATVAPVPEDAAVTEDRHVIAGFIVSPGNTQPAVEVILNWLKGF